MEAYSYTDGHSSDRIITRFLTGEDIPLWAGFFEDEESLRFLPDFGFTSNNEKAAHMINKQLDRYKEKRYGLQAIINKENGELLGLCGLLLQDVDGTKELEIGYHFFRKNWGKGYATEAARLFKNLGFETQQSDSIVSIIDVGNTRSQQVAIRNGMSLEKQIHWLDLEVYIYRVFNTGKTPVNTHK